MVLTGKSQWILELELPDTIAAFFFLNAYHVGAMLGVFTHIFA